MSPHSNINIHGQYCHLGTASVNTVGSNQTQINLTNVHDIHHQSKYLHPPQYV